MSGNAPRPLRPWRHYQEKYGDGILTIKVIFWLWDNIDFTDWFL